MNDQKIHDLRPLIKRAKFVSHLFGVVAILIVAIFAQRHALDSELSQQAILWIGVIVSAFQGAQGVEDSRVKVALAKAGVKNDPGA